MNDALAIGFEQRVRDRAYAMWENEGRPFGRDIEHWRLSEVATRAEQAPVAALPPAVKKGHKSKVAARKAAPVKRTALAHEAVAAF